MVKADLTRDYYGDLELQPGADIADIKKQFKKLALTYHPDRNPGRENEVTAKFQRIQSAHEVLIDPQERIKYDNNRHRASTRLGTAYAGGSGVRGNPWADAGSNFPPPPRHPTSRQPPHKPSAGAERYRKFDPPRQTTHQTAHEGAGARQKTYEAWENMKPKPGSKRPGNPPAPPPRNTPQSGQPESSTRAQPPPPRPRPNYDEFRQDATPASSPHSRSQSTNAQNRRGFMPNTPGGDEPAAPMGAYFTQRNKSSKAPDLPTREPDQSQPPQRPPKEPFQPAQHVHPDPLKQFRDSTMRPPTEPRVSTPYATHGGEKLNPFESANIHRSRSSREPSQRYDANGHMPRTGSDPNLSSPHRSKSFVGRGPSSRSKHHAAPSVEIESDSSDDGPQMSGRPFGKPRARKATNGTQIPDPATRPEPQRKPGKISQFRQWYKENPDQEPPLNGFPPDGPPLRPSEGQSQPQSNGEPSMYDNSTSLPSHSRRDFSYESKLPTVLETSACSSREKITNSDFQGLMSKQHPKLSLNCTTVDSPSGITESPITLTPFEGMQRDLVDALLLNKGSGSSSVNGRSPAKSDSRYINQISGNSGTGELLRDGHIERKEIDEGRNGPNKSRSRQYLHSFRSYDPAQAHTFWSYIGNTKPETNYCVHNSFSFSINKDTFESVKPNSRPHGLSSSAENISTKFSTQDWDGKFAAGADYFKPEQTGSGNPPLSRAQSGSRSRGRSPVKLRPVDPFSTQPKKSEPEPTVESPGGTKFSAKEWADTFRPQTFAPPPMPSPSRQVPTRKRTGPTLRPTLGGNAAIVDDGETSDEKPLLNSQKPPPTPTSSSPDAMDVDTPPVMKTVPQFQVNSAESRNVNITSPKRAAASSPTDEAALKVNFDDLTIQDLLSSLDMPRAPAPPQLPEISQGAQPSEAIHEEYLLRFAKYMTSWDLYNKQFMLHLIARKNQNDKLGTQRWLDEQGLEIYRRGLREDGIVLSRWAGEKERHEAAIRDWMVMKEKMKDAGVARPPRKKTH